MKFLKIKETCLYILDLEKAKDFYEGVLGLEVIHYLPKKHLFCRVGASVLLFFNPEDSRLKESPPAHFGGGNQHVAFEVPLSQYVITKREILDKGIEIIDEVTWESGRQSFYFKDPAGNILEILPDQGIWD